MPIATPGQSLIIDSRRGDECAHPRAGELVLEFLSCKRCGTEYVDGLLRFIPVQLRSQDPEGELHNSSYAGAPRAKEAVAEVMGAVFGEFERL